MPLRGGAEDRLSCVLRCVGKVVEGGCARGIAATDLVEDVLTRGDDASEDLVGLAELHPLWLRPRRRTARQRRLRWT